MELSIIIINYNTYALTKKCIETVYEFTKNIELVYKLAQKNKWTIKTDPKSLARTMAESDLAIGAPGSMSWERCMLMLPSVLIAIAENQYQIGESLNLWNVATYLGSYKKFDSATATNAINNFIQNKDVHELYSKNAGNLVDGNGPEKIYSEMRYFL